MHGVMLIFLAVYYVIILIPCVGTGLIGFRMLERLGRYPSRTPKIQMGVLISLVVLEVVSFALLLGFFKALVAED